MPHDFHKDFLELENPYIPPPMISGNLTATSLKGSTPDDYQAIMDKYNRHHEMKNQQQQPMINQIPPQRQSSARQSI
jgi:hypothetical protein